MELVHERNISRELLKTIIAGLTLFRQIMYMFIFNFTFFYHLRTTFG
jgi:hypothetical protein